MAETLTEEVVDELESWAKETGRHYKHVCEYVDESDIYYPQETYQPTVHQPVTIGCTIPLLIRHRTVNRKL